MGMLQASPDGAVRMMGLPVSFDGHRPASIGLAPELGADNEAWAE
jgi:hypothetical protein